MQRAQSNVEYLVIFGLAISAISVALGIFLVFNPSYFSQQGFKSTSGFAGLNVVTQGYTNGKFLIKFQNLLNENINVTGMFLFSPYASSTTYACNNKYVSALSFDTCNVTVTLPSSFTANLLIQYVTTNTSVAVPVNISGTVNN